MIINGMIQQNDVIFSACSSPIQKQNIQSNLNTIPSYFICIKNSPRVATTSNYSSSSKIPNRERQSKSISSNSISNLFAKFNSRKTINEKSLKYIKLKSYSLKNQIKNESNIKYPIFSKCNKNLSSIHFDENMLPNRIISKTNYEKKRKWTNFLTGIPYYSEKDKKEKNYRCILSNRINTPFNNQERKNIFNKNLINFENLHKHLLKARDTSSTYFHKVNKFYRMISNIRLLDHFYRNKCEEIKSSTFSELVKRLSIIHEFKSKFQRKCSNGNNKIKSTKALLTFKKK